jgi:hypothetical protein
MAILFIQQDGVAVSPIELNLGITRIGRAANNDVVINHSSVSSHHCNLELGPDSVIVRDCDSTNGTFVNDQRVQVARLEPGQSLRFGQVMATIEWSSDRVNVPKLAPLKVSASVVLGDGVLSCLKHEAVSATWHCPRCDHYFCTGCTRDVHLVGRPSRRTCPDCGGAVELAPWASAREKKQSLWGRIKKTFNRTARMR